ncbi:penicillin-binding protein [Cytobacillus purgationiresistens]|uniref:serine-type D-Ala-D-Ala carboxypeptidase n=1 Tax=Cytobacillus purgationiresistens TaxID=863449 RepID=A0ABU0ARS1_9BACI|nr:penicillin-binding protein [Cytobacillus purgationiresistens]MDQ0273895.1 penicillin-binding protein 2B [Cytobacillus purgationiresistens]
MNKKQPNINVGAVILFLIFSLLFFVLLFRFISIQVTGEAGGQVVAAKAKQLYGGQSIIEARRGTIFDRNGEVIAEDANSYQLIAILSNSMTTDKDHPKHVVEPEKTAKELAKYIDMDEGDIYKRLTIGGDPFQVEFGSAGRDLSIQTKKELEELKLPGIIFQQDTNRFYPNGLFASHSIGYVDKQKNEEGKVVPQGMMGLEMTLNDLLTGTDGKFSYESDLWGYLLPNGDEVVKPAKNGKDVYLTIDKKIQIFLEDAMSKVDEEYSPEKMIAIVADPKTGDILGMSQRPSFDPKTKEGIDQTWRNLAIEDSFEPGSTMKIFTLAAAIEEGVFQPDASFQSGSYKVTEKSPQIKDHNGGKGWGTISYLEGIQRSSNVAIAKMVKEQLGYDTYREYLTEFGFDRPTGIDLPNETGGKIVYEWPLEKATTGFGQGTAITPMQQIQAATAIADDGKMKKPHVIKEIVDADKEKTEQKTKTEIAGQPISANTAKKVRDILETVVSSENGTGFNRYNIDGYEVAGKTGTAQIPKSGGGYLTGHENYVFSFIGMAPADDPELIVYVAVQQPDIDLSTNGAEPVSQIFKPVMKNSLSYLNIEPSDYAKLQVNETPNVSGMKVETAKKKLEELGLDPVVIGDGAEVAEQVPGDTFNMLEGEKVLIKTDGKLTVPDLGGWSLRDVLKFVKISNLKLNSVGNGYVVKQNLSPGSILSDGDYLIVELESPGNRAQQAEDEGAQDESSENGEEADEVRD